MLICKGDKEYNASELQTAWKVERTIGGVTVEYKVSKELAQTIDELERYIVENDDLF